MTATLTLPAGTTLSLETPSDLDQALAPMPCCDRYRDGRLYPKTRVKAVPKSRGFDTYYCDAIALCCGRRLGTVVVRCSTIFGLEEDERVLNGRARVY